MDIYNHYSYKWDSAYSSTFKSICLNDNGTKDFSPRAIDNQCVLKTSSGQYMDVTTLVDFKVADKIKESRESAKFQKIYESSQK